MTMYQVEVLLLVQKYEGLRICELTRLSTLGEKSLTNVIRDLGDGRPDKTNGKYLMRRDKETGGVYLTDKGKYLLTSLD